MRIPPRSRCCARGRRRTPRSSRFHRMVRDSHPRTATTWCRCGIFEIPIPTRLHRLSKASIEIGGLRDACAVRALAAEIGQPVGLRGIETVESLRQHQREGVLPRPRRSREHNGVRQSVAPQHVAQATNSFRIAVKVRKRHKASSPRSHRDTESQIKPQIIVNRGPNSLVFVLLCVSVTLW